MSETMQEAGRAVARRSVLIGTGATAVTASMSGGARASNEGGPARTTIFRGSVLHFLHDPGDPPNAKAWELFEDGALVVDKRGKVAWVGAAQDVPRLLRAGARTVNHGNKLIVPGFVDTHIHYSQVDVIASFGEQLLTWLQKYVFPAERRLRDASHARMLAGFFLDRLLAAGTTTASVFPTVHPVSVDAFFEQAERRRLRMLCGKVLMDREPYAPSYLRDASVAQAEHETRALIARWHGRGRLGYSLTPRFAPTSTEHMLEMTGRLHQERPDVWLQTHLAENKAEVALVDKLFGGRSYLSVYERYGLVNDRSLFAHSIHIDDTDRRLLATRRAGISFCPTSNLFLGSGLFDLHAARRHRIDVGMGTDIGAGTSYSILRTLGEAYKVAALQGRRLSAQRGLYLATLGGAQVLDLDDVIGNFRPGKEADFTVLDFAATPVLARRTEVAQDLIEALFALMTLGDERAVTATYVLGQEVHRQ